MPKKKKASVKDSGGVLGKLGTDGRGGTEELKCWPCPMRRWWKCHQKGRNRKLGPQRNQQGHCWLFCLPRQACCCCYWPLIRRWPVCENRTFERSGFRSAWEIRTDQLERDQDRSAPLPSIPAGHQQTWGAPPPCAKKGKPAPMLFSSCSSACLGWATFPRMRWRTFFFTIGWPRDAKRPGRREEDALGIKRD